MKKNITQWLDEYGSNHQNQINEIIHFFCVPIIFFCVVGMLLAISTWLLGFIVIIAAIFYCRLSIKLALGMLFVLVIMLCVLLHLPFLVWICTGLFILAWIFQFIGHFFEGKKPSFFKEILFLFIGPLWILSLLYKKFKISY